jgi:prolipoprotein diacylglyceryltransferase
VIIGVGASLGLWRVYQQVPRWQASRWVNSALLTLLGALLGARLYFVALYWPYYSQHPIEIIEIWLGGLAWPGAIMGAILLVALVSLSWRCSFGKVADALSPLAAPIAICAWLGCWVSGIAYGAVAPPGAFWGIPTLDETGLYALRIPVQALAAVSLLAFFLWLDGNPRLFRETGQRSSVTCLALAVNLLGFSLLRADPSPFWNGLRPDTWAAIIFTLASLVAFGISIFYPRAARQGLIKDTTT